jgi:hypothetical protein
MKSLKRRREEEQDQSQEETVDDLETNSLLSRKGRKLFYRYFLVADPSSCGESDF